MKTRATKKPKSQSVMESDSDLPQRRSLQTILKNLMTAKTSKNDNNDIHHSSLPLQANQAKKINQIRVRHTSTTSVKRRERKPRGLLCTCDMLQSLL